MEAFSPRGSLTEEELRAEGLAELRWLSVEEIAVFPHEPGAVTAPREMAAVLASLLRDGDPARMLRLGT